MDLNRVTSELKTHEEVSPSLDTTYSLVELFQRQIDIERVKREIVEGYLRIPNKIKFFNSLTIVLLPKSKEGKIVSTFENYENNDPPIPDPQFGEFDKFFAPGQAADKKSVFGGVQFVTTITENLARLRWDMRRVDAVAVDGQHRLKALKIWMEGKNGQLSDIERPTRVPVIFLMLHEGAGFVGAANGGTAGIRGIAREIFTDLNKNAREVDLATQIILDDLSVESCCVRSLVTTATCTDDDTLLPLTLLRWQDANNRFDQKYYLNSLVNLHLIVKDLLGLKAPEPMNKDDVSNFIDSVSNLLGTGSPRALIHEGVTLREYYDKNFFEGDDLDPIAPFSGLPSHYLPSAVNGFKEYFSPWLLAILRRFAPYAEIITYAREQKLMTGQFGQYLSQPRSHQEQLAKDLAYQHGEQWRKIIIDDHSAAIEKIKGAGPGVLGEQWAFKTIFQKSLVRLGRTIFVQVPPDERARFGDVEDYLYFLNVLYKGDLLRVHAPLPGSAHGLWVFIAVNWSGRKIRVSATSEARILGLLTIWYFGLRYAREQQRTIILSGSKSEGTIAPSEILKYFSTKASQSKWPTAYDHVSELLKLFKSDANAGVIAAPFEANTEEEREKFAKERLEQVFCEGLRPFAKASDISDQI
jgi:hypothetical protein